MLHGHRRQIALHEQLVRDAPNADRPAGLSDRDCLFQQPQRCTPHSSLGVHFPCPSTSFITCRCVSRRFAINPFVTRQTDGQCCRRRASVFCRRCSTSCSLRPSPRSSSNAPCQLSQPVCLVSVIDPARRTRASHSCSPGVPCTERRVTQPSLFLVATIDTS